MKVCSSNKNIYEVMDLNLPEGLVPYLGMLKEGRFKISNLTKLGIRNFNKKRK